MKNTSLVLTCFLILLIVAGACRTTKSTQTEYVYIHDTDTVEKVKVKFDSIVVSDSVIIYQKGDTVFKEKYHTELKDRLRVDTVFKVITRNLYYTKEKEVEKEVNRLYWWQKCLMWVGGIGIVFMIFFIIRALRSRIK